MSLDAFRAVVLMPDLRAAWPLAFVLAGMAGRDGRLWPSVKYLCVRMDLSAGRVKRHMRTLRDAGVLVDTGVRKGKSGRVVVYRLNLPPLAALQTEMERRLAEARTGDDARSRINGIGNGPINNEAMVSETDPLDGVNGAISDTGIGLFPMQQSGRFRHTESVRESITESGGVTNTTATGSRDAPTSESAILGNATSRQAIAQMRASLHCRKAKP